MRRRRLEKRSRQQLCQGRGGVGVGRCGTWECGFSAPHFLIHRTKYTRIHTTHTHLHTHTPTHTPTHIPKYIYLDDIDAYINTSARKKHIYIYLYMHEKKHIYIYCIDRRTRHTGFLFKLSIVKTPCPPSLLITSTSLLNYYHSHNVYHKY